jgi:hypothetical protein
MINTVQIYVEPCEGHDGRMLELTKRSWELQGWRVEVQGPQCLPLDEALAVDRNSRNLTYGLSWSPRVMAPYHRWLAHHEGWTSDHDIVNVSFTPEDADALLKQQPPNDDKLIIISQRINWAGHSVIPPTPAYLTEGTREDLLDMFSKLSAEHAKLLKFVDDQRLINLKYAHRVTHIPICLAHPQEGWEKAPLIHFVNCMLPKHAGTNDRFGVMRKLLKEAGLWERVTTPSSPHLH